MKFNHFFVAILSIGLLFASCKKNTPAPTTPTATVDANESKNNAISANSWTVTSYTENGQERMQSALNSFTMTYKKEDKNNGTATWALIDLQGGSQNVSDKYEIRNNGTEIDLGGDILGFTVSGSSLTIEGNYNGTAVRIVAKK
ncbi:MAG: hypothetical protein JNL72_10950 [Flavipsychrobacter sp.]|nr:hypothetical protein [Flavipsychrobacter sp.]